MGNDSSSSSSDSGSDGSNDQSSKDSLGTSKEQIRHVNVDSESVTVKKGETKENSQEEYESMEPREGSIPGRAQPDNGSPSDESNSDDKGRSDESNE